jgi:hypothetical protein
VSSQHAPSAGSQTKHVIVAGAPSSATAREIDRFNDPRTARYLVKTRSDLTWTGEQPSGAVGEHDPSGKPVHIVPREGWQ